ncbi:MAG: hypothetical protein EBR01_12155 [Proteobacteria bacterium]|nr:hypothetical protein [Pseudomonadota bacterium]
MTSFEKHTANKTSQVKVLQNQAEEGASLSKESFVRAPSQKKKVRKLLTPEQQVKKVHSKWSCLLCSSKQVSQGFVRKSTSF